jgi:MYXO-CTERM domain-containing protein
VSSTETLQAIASAPGYAVSAVASSTYTVPGSGTGGGAASPALLGLLGLGVAARRRRKG